MLVSLASLAAGGGAAAAATVLACWSASALACAWSFCSCSACASICCLSCAIRALSSASSAKGGAETRRSLGLAKPGATAAAGLGDAAAARSPTSAAAGSSAGLRPGRLQARSSMPALSCASVEETGWLFPRREGLAVAYRGRRGKPGGFLSENHRDHSSREDQFAARGDPQSILATTVVDQQFTAAVQQRRARNPQWAGVVARRRSAIGI